MMKFKSVVTMAALAASLNTYTFAQSGSIPANTSKWKEIHREQAEEEISRNFVKVNQASVYDIKPSELLLVSGSSGLGLIGFWMGWSNTRQLGYDIVETFVNDTRLVDTKATGIDNFFIKHTERTFGGQSWYLREIRIGDNSIVQVLERVSDHPTNAFKPFGKPMLFMKGESRQFSTFLTKVFEGGAFNKTYYAQMLEHHPLASTSFSSIYKNMTRIKMGRFSNLTSLVSLHENRYMGQLYKESQSLVSMKPWLERLVLNIKVSELRLFKGSLFVLGVAAILGIDFYLKLEKDTSVLQQLLGDVNRDIPLKNFNEGSMMRFFDSKGQDYNNQAIGELLNYSRDLVKHVN